MSNYNIITKGKGSPYSIAERRVLKLTPVLDSQPAGDVSHQPGGRLTLLSTRPAVTLGWLGSRVVSVLDSGTVGPGFKSQPRRCRVAVLGKLFTPIVPLFTKQQNW